MAADVDDGDLDKLGITSAELYELEVLTRKHRSTLHAVLAEIVRDRGIQPTSDDDGSVYDTVIRALPQFNRVLLDRLRELDRDGAPQLELIETCWRLRSPQKHILTCGIYRTSHPRLEVPGLEVRAWLRREDDRIRCQRTAEIGSAREIAEAWRHEFAKEGFEQLDPPDSRKGE
jgi:hypothetical protein